MRVTLDSRAIRAVIHAAPKTSTRPDLPVGALLSPGCIVATDGFRLARVTWEPTDGEEGSVILPLAALKAAAKAKGMLTVNGTIEHDGGAISYTPIEGSFPRYETVIPADDAPRMAASIVNPELLAESLAGAAALKGGPRTAPIKARVLGCVEPKPDPKARHAYPGPCSIHAERDGMAYTALIMPLGD